MIIVLVAVRFFAGLSKQTVDRRRARIALVASGLSFVAAIYAGVVRSVARTRGRERHGRPARQQRSSGSASFNVEYFVGVDGLCISMVLLSGLVSFIATIASMPWWSAREGARDGRDDRRTATTTRTTRSTSRCGWSPATWSCCCSCRPA